MSNVNAPVPRGGRKLAGQLNDPIRFDQIPSQILLHHFVKRLHASLWPGTPACHNSSSQTGKQTRPRTQQCTGHSGRRRAKRMFRFHAESPIPGNTGPVPGRIRAIYIASAVAFKGNSGGCLEKGDRHFASLATSTRFFVGDLPVAPKQDSFSVPSVSLW